MNEERLRALSKWQSVAEIPKFPFPSLEKLLEAEAEGICQVSVDRAVGVRLFRITTPNAVVYHLCNFLSLVPFVLVFVCLAAAFASHRYWLLAGVLSGPAGLIAGGMTVGFFRGAGTFITGLAIAILLLCVLSGKITASLVLGGYVISFCAVRLYLQLGTHYLLSGIRRSEALFLYAASHGICRLRAANPDRFIWPLEERGTPQTPAQGSA